MKTILAQLIEEAVDECIIYGVGHTSNPTHKLEVGAVWDDNEEDIEITIYEKGIACFTYIENRIQGGN